MNQDPLPQVMLYDDHCPLCKAYTAAFVKSGMLKEENRIPFTRLQENQFSLDWQRARNEIPVLDLETGTVHYGIDALAAVLRQKFPWIPLLLRIKAFRWFFTRMYKLVSYNRRLIVADRHEEVCGIDCRPDFNSKYRWLLSIISFALACSFLQLAYSFWWTNSGFALFAWMLIPPLLSLGKSRRVTADIFAHSGILSLMVAFWVLISSALQKISGLHFPFIFLPGALLSVYVLINEIIKRKACIKNTISSETLYSSTFQEK